MNNKWLIENQTIEQTKFSNKDYLKECFKELKEYFNKAPIPMVSQWKESGFKLEVFAGKNSQEFQVSPKINPKDLIYFIETTWARQFYPSYTVTLKFLRGLTTDEKATGIQADSFTLEESHFRQVEDTKKEKAIITRVFIPEDKFTIITNDVTSVRSTTIPITVFLSNIRKIKNYDSLREYILENSVVDNNNAKEHYHTITYNEDQLLNFFKIRNKELFIAPLKPGSNNTVIIGKYNIYFPNEYIKEKCLRSIHKWDQI
jgi:hypothetical protein